MKGFQKLLFHLLGRRKRKLLGKRQLVKDLKPDVVEWRVDLYEDVENLAHVKEMITMLRSTFAQELLLFTFRTHKEGGSKVISEEFYVQLNQTAIKTGDIDLVDVELFTGDEHVKAILSTAKESGVFVIMSNHDFEKTPDKEEIVSRLRKMQEYGADIPKIAVMPKSVADVLTLLGRNEYDENEIWRSSADHNVNGWNRCH